jgi:hypothetical protein
MDEISFVDSIRSETNKVFVKNSAPYAVLIYGGEFIATAEPYLCAIENPNAIMTLSAVNEEYCEAPSKKQTVPQSLH